jgi:hypothetical protein
MAARIVGRAKYGTLGTTSGKIFAESSTIRELRSQQGHSSESVGRRGVGVFGVSFGGSECLCAQHDFCGAGAAADVSAGCARQHQCGGNTSSTLHARHRYRTSKQVIREVSAKFGERSSPDEPALPYSQTIVASGYSSINWA